MDTQQAIGCLVGKTIAKVDTYRYFDWDVIERIVFTDGAVLELTGHADCAMISSLDGEVVEAVILGVEED